VPGCDFFGTPREFAPRQWFENKRRDEPVTEQGDFFGFGIHREGLPDPEA
jgi:hypothetical protein